MVSVTPTTPTYRLYIVLQAIGNHEFDKGPSKLVEFLRLIKFPAVCSNMDVSNEPKWPKSETLFTKSKIIETGGEKIAIIGYLTKDTTWWVFSELPKVVFKLKGDYPGHPG